MSKSTEVGPVGTSGRRALERLVLASGEPSPPDWIRLNTNELSIPPSRLVTEAIARAGLRPGRYPHPLGEPLRSELALHHGVSVDNVLVAAGADGVLTTCFRAFCDPGSRIARLTRTYPYLRNLAVLYSGIEVTAPDASEVLSISRSGGADMAIIVNPNSPTGIWISPAELTGSLDWRGVLVIDEAYAPFAPSSVLDEIDLTADIVVVRSFSKAYGLAGLRLGYAIGNSELIRRMSLTLDPYPVSVIALEAGVAALRDTEHHVASILEVRRERRRLTNGLRELGWHVEDSQANFVFACPPTLEVAGYVENLRANKILVRTFSGAEQGIRISVGSSNELDQMLRVLGQSIDS